ncbi:DUF421 domain-containing protein [Peptococcaceae bacterium 1198_IL3148]
MNPHFEIAIRAVGAFFAVLIITRVLGKEQMGQLAVSDFVNAIAIGSIAANMATDHKENVSYYIIGIIIFGGLTYAINYVALKSRTARKILEGEPTVVIHNGKLLEKNMAKMRYSVDHVTMQLREKNVFNIADVEFAVAEPHGELSVLLKSDKQPLTPRDVNIATDYQGVPSELIVDGKIIYQNLQQNNLSKDWLLTELNKQGVSNVKDVVFASLDSAGNLYVDKYQDQLTYVQDISDKIK